MTTLVSTSFPRRFASALLTAGFTLALGHSILAEPVTVKPFGKADGQKIDLYTLANSHGVKAAITNYGATVVDLFTPDREGKPANISLGFNSVKPYESKKKDPYFGATIGRYANRIANGEFTLDGKKYQLAKNDPPNALHGGIKGFDKRVWKAEIVKAANPTVRFTLHSADGEEGYPGAMDVAVEYTLTEKNNLEMHFSATTDKPTVVNLTNHTYFNLHGSGNGSILDHVVTIPADRYTPVNATLIPTGELKKVEGTVMDFRKPTAIGLRIKEVGGKPIGYDHNYVLNKGLFGSGVKLNAEVHDPVSGRVLDVSSDQPGVQFYSGNFLDGTVTGREGKVYKQYTGFCVEPQHFPDSPNKPSFPSVVLRPGQTYRSTIVFHFGVK